MAAADDSLNREVSLGFDAPWGFAPADQTSPARAAEGGALVDVRLVGEQVTELRIHGVSGSDGPTMLEHPTALQVAGDSVTGFYRRWTPDGSGKASVPWKLEAYSWGGLTEAPLASASWLLLAPFMMYNLAYFMLPPQDRRADESGRSGGGHARSNNADENVKSSVPHLSRDVGHGIAQMLLRLLALAATVQLVSAVTVVTVSMVAWGAADRKGLLPEWMGWYGRWPLGSRAAAGLLAVAVVVAALWLMSGKTATRYELRTSEMEPELNRVWPLTQQGFWKGLVLVSRQRALHAAAACAAAALIVSYPASHPSWARWLAFVYAAAVLAAALGLAASPVADRHVVTVARGGQPTGSRAGRWCDVVLIGGVVAVVASALAVGLTDHRSGPQPGALPGLTGFLLVLLVVQLALLIALACVVTVIAVRAPRGETGFEPYLHGGLSALIAAVGFALGGLMTAIVNFGAARLLGTPEPSGFTHAPANAVYVPWPIYAFGAGLAGALLGGVLAALMMYLRYRHNYLQFDSSADKEPAVTDAYQGGSGPAFNAHRRAIAKAWAVGLVADDAATAVALTVGCAMAFAVAFEFLGLVNAGTVRVAGWWSGLASATSICGLLVVSAFVALLRDAYSNTAKRKTIGALWDVATFWPRAVHPFAPPCYGERLIPEVVDRIGLLTGLLPSAVKQQCPSDPDRSPAGGVSVPPGPVLLTGYSQGSIIAPAVAAQLPPEVRERVAMLTLACPARRLYGRAFPAYFGLDQLSALADMLGGKGPAGRWKNLVRRADFIGSWIFKDPEPVFDGEYLQDHVDQACLDPVVLVPDSNPTPPPTHRHSGWWPDPRSGELAAYLVRQLSQPITQKDLEAQA